MGNRYADPLAQLAAAKLWAIMLQNSGGLFISQCESHPASPQLDLWIAQTAEKKFMETVESVILSPTTSPVVRERLIDVLAVAAFTFHGPGKEGLQSTWQRVRPPNKPEEGIPFDNQDPMFDPKIPGHRERMLRSSAPQVTSLNLPHSPYVHRLNPSDQEVEQDYEDWHQGNNAQGNHLRKGSEFLGEDVQLLNECDAALCNTRILNEALAYSTPNSFHSNPIIKV